MKYKTIKRINWFITRITLLFVVGFLIGFSVIGIEPMRNQAIISASLLIVSGLSMLVEYFFWISQKNPR